MPVFPLPNGLGTRLAGLPLILAGPILRRVEATQVSVWIATKLPTPVTLRVFEEDGTTLRMQGTVAANDGVSQINFGANLFLTCITATPTGGPLVPGKIYLYSLTFNPGETLTSPNILTTAGGTSAALLVAYTGSYQLPSFCLPGSTLATLRLAHMSCRKPHAEALDAMQIIDEILNANAKTAANRPQQLMMTGDQIYADDVADVLLALLTDAGDTLLGQTETFPGFTTPKAPKDLLPGKRRDVAEQAGLTINEGSLFAGAVGQSHLFGLGEFFAMYIMAFSDTIWPGTLPTYAQVFPGAKASGDDFDRYQTQSANLKLFKALLPFARRVLANVATYMIIDDHEVTDDFYMNRDWMDRVLRPRTGTADRPSTPDFPVRLIQNALTSYALFQHWGNRPTQLAAEQSWKTFVKAVTEWIQLGFDVTGAAAQLSKIQAALTLPTAQLGPNAFEVPLTPNSLLWSYAARWAIHETLVIDTRARRAFPRNGPLNAVLLAPSFTLTEVTRDISAAPALPAGAVSVVIVPSSIVPIPGVESGKHVFPTEAKRTYTSDLESLFNSANAFDKLLSGLAERAGAPQQLAILSGDVHYGYAAKLYHWLITGFNTASATLAAAAFTSSAARNQRSDSQLRTTRMHENGFGATSWVPPPVAVTRITWNVPIAKEKDFRVSVGTVKASGKPIDPRLYASVDAGYPTGGSGGISNRRAAIEDIGQASAAYQQVRVTVVPRSATQTLLLPATGGADRGIVITPIPTIPTGKQARVDTTAAAQANAIVNAKKRLPGVQIVGLNNIGIITFANGNATQELWWWLDDLSVLAKAIFDQLQAGSTRVTVPAAKPFSTFDVSLVLPGPPTLDVIKG